MRERLTRRDLAWGYSAQFVNLAGGIVLLPLLVIFLTPEEVGLWFVFLTMASLAQLIELGLQPTLARNAAYVFTGVNDLRSEGVSYANLGACVDVSLLRRLVNAGRRTYRLVAITVGGLLFVAGSAYVGHLQSSHPGAIHSAVPAWLAYSGGIVVTSYFGYYNAFIIGRGDVAHNNIIIVATKGSFIVLGATGVILGFGMLGLGIASLISGIAGRFLANHYFRLDPRSLNADPTADKNSTSLLLTLWPNAWRLSLVQLGSFLIVRANTLIASTFVSLTLVASYGLTVQLLLVFSGIASQLASLQLPRMNAAQVRADRAELQRALGLAVVSSWLLFGICIILIMTFGGAALEGLGKNIRLPDSGILCTLIVVTFLEMNHSIAAAYLTTLNRIPFTLAAIVSGFLMIIISSILCGWLNLGLWGLVVAQGSVQLVYNNWKWPLEALKHLEIGPLTLLRLGLGELGHVLRGR
ncbi:MAG: O-unit flippase-like protein [Burkholderiaceae bacterium]